MTHDRLWYLVMNSNKARILRGAGVRGLPEGPEYLLATRHPRLRDHLDDKPFRSFWAGPHGQQAAIQPTSDPVRAEKLAFCRDVAAFVAKALSEGEFDGLILVAPADALGFWRQVETPELHRVLRSEHRANLVRLTHAALAERLAQLAPPDLS